MAVFPKNEGFLDRVIRITVGVILISLAFVGPTNPWFFLGVIPLVTGLVGRCPAYKILGINSCSLKRK